MIQGRYNHSKGSNNERYSSEDSFMELSKLELPFSEGKRTRWVK
jgi:hypothetical protein